MGTNDHKEVYCSVQNEFKKVMGISEIIVNYPLILSTILLYQSAISYCVIKLVEYTYLQQEEITLLIVDKL